MKYLLASFVLLFATISVIAQSRIIRPEMSLDVCKTYGGEYLAILGSPYRNEYRRFKLKAAGSVNSGTAREADYIEFKLMEPVYVADNSKRVLFPKDTSVFGIVTRRRSRHFPAIRGKLELQLEPLLNWNGERVEIAIARHGPLRKSETSKERKRRNDPCKEKTDDPSENCVAGRGDAPVSAIVTGIAGAAPAAVSAIGKDEDTKFIAATAFFNVAKDLANLLMGTDVGISKDDIFDLVFDTKPVCWRKPD